MKRDRRKQGELLLKETEASLREALLFILPQVAISGEQIFLNSEFNPTRLPKHQLSEKAEALLEASRLCIQVRESLNLPLSDSVGHLYLSACTESASADEHRRGPRRLSADMLEKIKAGRVGQRS